ncbi:MAG: hypothetical protein Q4A39_00815 [Eubacteriales bacterium]|nr:hypothetical protein [Eubacteriales bacterium]
MKDRRESRKSFPDVFSVILEELGPAAETGYGKSAENTDHEFFVPKLEKKTEEQAVSAEKSYVFEQNMIELLEVV